MKSVNMLIKFFIMYINNVVKTAIFSGFITNDHMP